VLPSLRTDSCWCKEQICTSKHSEAFRLFYVALSGIMPAAAARAALSLMIACFGIIGGQCNDFSDVRKAFHHGNCLGEAQRSPLDVDYLKVQPLTYPQTTCPRMVQDSNCQHTLFYCRHSDHRLGSCHLGMPTHPLATGLLARLPRTPLLLGVQQGIVVESRP